MQQKYLRQLHYCRLGECRFASFARRQCQEFSQICRRTPLTLLALIKPRSPIRGREKREGEGEKRTLGNHLYPHRRGSHSAPLQPSPRRILIKGVRGCPSPWLLNRHQHDLPRRGADSHFPTLNGFGLAEGRSGG